MDRNEHIWEASNLRFTIFPEENFAQTPESLWPNVEGAEINQQTQQLRTLQTILLGNYSNKGLTLTFNPGQTNLVLAAPVNFNASDYPNLGTYDTSVEEFKPLVSALINQLETEHIKRIAFGAELIHRVESMTEGYEQISHLIPLTVNAETESDFRLQINRFTTSSIINNLRINRATVWEVATFNRQIITIPPSTTPPTVPPAQYFMHLLIDLNTDFAYEGVITKEQAHELFDEFIQQGRSLATQGIH